MPLKVKIRKIIASTIFLFFAIQSCQCFGITIKEEQELGQEFMRMVRSRMPLIQDPGVNAYVNEIGQEIVKQIGPQPFEYQFYVVRDDAFNAFAGPGAHVCVNSGLIAKMEDESELAGILGHEIAHVTCRHISEKIQRASKTNLLSLAGMVAGIFLGIGGMAEASQAVIMGTLSGVQSADLAYSREDEVQADFYGLEYLEEAGYDSRGLLKALKRIKEADYLGAEYPIYLSTHPAVDDRIVFISSRLKENPKTPNHHTTISFKQAQARLIVESGNRDQAINTYKSEYIGNPENPIANYGYGLALFKAGQYGQSIDHLEKAIHDFPKDPYLITDLGKAYFMNNEFKKAIDYFEDANRLSHDSENDFYLGKCQMELGDLDKAEATFKTLISPPPKNLPVEIKQDLPETEKPPSKQPDPVEAFFKPPNETPIQLKAIYSLAEVYHRGDRMGDSHFYLGTYYQKLRRADTARFHFTKALEFKLDEEKRKEIGKILEMLDKADKIQRSRSKRG